MQVQFYLIEEMNVPITSVTPFPIEFQATFFPHQIFILPVIGCTHKKHKANWNPFIIDILKNITSLASNDVTESENLA